MTRKTWNEFTARQIWKSAVGDVEGMNSKAKVKTCRRRLKRHKQQYEGEKGAVEDEEGIYSGAMVERYHERRGRHKQQGKVGIRESSTSDDR